MAKKRVKKSRGGRSSSSRKKVVRRSSKGFNLRKKSKVSLLIYGLIAGIITIIAFVLLVSAMKNTPTSSTDYVNLQ